MSGVNKAIILGHVGRDAETRYTAEGVCVTNVSVACTEKYKDKQGTPKELTEWMNVVFFGKLAEIAGEFIKKGSLIYVEGKLRTEKYTDKESGVEKFSTKIIASYMQLLGGKSNGSSNPVEQSNSLDDDIPL